jgi:hypothetical protein
MGSAAKLTVSEAGSGTIFKIDGSGSLKIDNTTNAINVQKGILELDTTLDSASAALDITGTSNGAVKLSNIGTSYSKAIAVGETKLQLGSADRIHNSSDLTLNNGGVLDLNNVSERVNNLSFNNGGLILGRLLALIPCFLLIKELGVILSSFVTLRMERISLARLLT